MKFNPIRKAAAAAAAALALTLGVGAAPVAQAQVGLPAPVTSSDNTSGLLRQQGCKPRYLIAVPGGANTIAGVPTFLPHGGNVFSVGLMAQAATAGEMQPLWVSYNSAAFANRPYYSASADAYGLTRSTVAKLANACPSATFSFTGYSLGADVAARLTRDIAYGNGPIGPERVDGVALIANPYQGGNGAALAPGTSPESRGALGELEGGYGQLAGRVLEICRPDDIVCSTDERHRPLVEPALRTHISAGHVPVGEFQAIFRGLGADSRSVFRGMDAHGQYTSWAPRAAADWIVSHRGGQ